MSIACWNVVAKSSTYALLHLPASPVVDFSCSVNVAMDAKYSPARPDRIHHKFLLTFSNASREFFSISFSLIGVLWTSFSGEEGVVDDLASSDYEGP